MALCPAPAAGCLDDASTTFVGPSTATRVTSNPYPAVPSNVSAEKHLGGPSLGRSTVLQRVVQKSHLRAGNLSVGDKTQVDPGSGSFGKHFWWGSKEQLIFTACCYEEQLKESVKALASLVHQGLYVHTSVFYHVLKRCIVTKDLLLGQHVHALCVKSRYESNTFLANHIICMYASHGRLREARQVFYRVSEKDCYVWASIIFAHARQGQPAEAIRLYREMQCSSVKPDNHVFVAILQACAAAGNFAVGKEVHGEILSSVVKPDIFLLSCLVSMYAKCGRLEEARELFDRLPSKNVVTWTAMITAYVERGCGQGALSLYASMQRTGIPPNHFTYSSVLRACVVTGDLHQGQQFHAEIQGKGLEGNIVIGGCLVDMYTKCGSLLEARSVFDRLPAKSVVTWNSIIAGYAQQELGEEALKLYDSMVEEGKKADLVTFLSLLKACASAGAVQKGEQLHAQIREMRLEGVLSVGNCLVDMYAKCGRLEDARRVFSALPTKDVVTWTALLNGYAENGDGQTALSCYQEMLQHGVLPDSATFLCLLVSCRLDGLVNDGQRYFKTMVDDYGIQPSMAHYNCMVDLLGRSGRLDEAERILQTMPYSNPVVGWRSLLCACRSYNDITRGQRCFDHIMAMEPENATAYVLLGHMYANAGMWEDVSRVEHLRKQAGAKKKPGKACIEVENRVHEFVVGDVISDTSSRSRSMGSRLKEDGGHVPHTQLVSTGVADGDKEDALCGHAEKLALAYGLLNTPDGQTLLVTKNLRMCSDCHSATKVISRLEKRLIVVRDAYLVHHFADGSCSCGDRHVV